MQAFLDEVVDGVHHADVDQAAADAAAAGDAERLLVLDHGIEELAVEAVAVPVVAVVPEVLAPGDLGEGLQLAAVPQPPPLALLEVIDLDVVLDVEAVAGGAHQVARPAGQAALPQ